MKRREAEALVESIERGFELAELVGERHLETDFFAIIGSMLFTLRQLLLEDDRHELAEIVKAKNETLATLLVESHGMTLAEAMAKNDSARTARAIAAFTKNRRGAK